MASPAFTLLRLCLAFACLAAPLRAEERPPNLILILADDLGYHDLGSYGQEKIATPRLDQLAREGTRFTRAYSGSSVCAPARATLMTGLHSGHTRIRGNFPAEGGFPDMNGHPRLPLAADETILPEILGAAGYRNAATGKWGLGENGSGGEPNHKGFHEWFGFLNQRHAHGYYPEFQWHDGRRVEIPGNLDGRRETYSHDLHTEFALDFIRRAAREEQPFFLYLPYQIPHERYEIPSLGPYADRDWPDEAKVHAAMIHLLDRDVGRLLDLLDELGLSENSLVLFTSDNGAAHRWEGLFDSSHPFRGRKRDLLEGGIRVPAIVRGPGIPAGSVSDAIWYFPDIFPTFARLAGVAPDQFPDDLDGIDVLPAWSGEDQAELSERVLYWEFHERGFDQAVIQGRWKALRSHGTPLEVYDLEADPGESRDLAAARPEIAAALAAAMDRSRRPSRHWPAPGESPEP